MLTFKNRPGKREIQNKIFSQVKNKTIFGLGGPNIKEYIDILVKNGFTKINIYENNINTINKQVPELKTLRNKEQVSIIYGDIHKNLNNTDCFYDLDYCGNINTIRPYLKKINKINKFSLTFMMRGFIKGEDGFYIENILNKELFDGKLKIKISSKGKKLFNNQFIIHNGYKYTFYTYRDTCPMIMIFKTKYND